jgi:hypothetical protein
MIGWALEGELPKHCTQLCFHTNQFEVQAPTHFSSLSIQDFLIVLSDNSILPIPSYIYKVPINI